MSWAHKPYFSYHVLQAHKPYFSYHFFERMLRPIDPASFPCKRPLNSNHPIPSIPSIVPSLFDLISSTEPNLSHYVHWVLPMPHSLNSIHTNLLNSPHLVTFHRSFFIQPSELCTVPLMLVRTLPITGTCTYEPTRRPCYRWQALSGHLNLLPMGCSGV